MKKRNVRHIVGIKIIGRCVESNKEILNDNKLENIHTLLEFGQLTYIIL